MFIGYTPFQENYTLAVMIEFYSIQVVVHVLFYNYRTLYFFAMFLRYEQLYL